MKRLPNGLLVVMVLALVAGQVGVAADKPANPPAPAFAFTLKDQDGKDVSLKDHAGKIVVLEWINWECPFYRRHQNAGTMKKLATKYADKGVVWLGINSTKHHDVQKNKKWQQDNDVPYPVLDDHEGTVGRMFSARTTPQIVILDKKHRLAYNGAIDDDPRGSKLKEGTARNYADQALAELIAGKEVSMPKTRPYGCTVKYAPPKPAGKEAPAFTLKDENGKDVSLSDLAGKTVVLEWINPDCPIWMRHFRSKTMIDLASKYQKKDVVWLAINTTHYWTQAKNKQFAENLPYPILNDQDGTVGRKYGAKTTPDMRIIDAKGNLLYSGAIDDDPSGRKLKKGTAKNYVDEILAQVTAGKSVSYTETRPYGCSVKYAKRK